MYLLIVALVGFQAAPVTGFDYPRQMFATKQGCELDAKRIVNGFTVHQSDDKNFKRAYDPTVLAYCVPVVDPRKPGG